MASPLIRPWITLLFLTTLSSAVPSPYSDHCRSTVPESTLVTGSFSDASASASFNLSTGYFFGGALLLRPDLADPSLASSFHFRLRSLRRTRTPGVFHVAGNLTLTDDGYQAVSWSVSTWRSTRQHTSPRLRLPRRRKVVTFVLSGFWSDSTSKLCMVGPGFAPSNAGTPATFSAVFKLNYPKISNISTRLVTGTLQSLDAANNSTHFNPISVLTYLQNNYRYTQLPRAKESCSHLDTLQNSLSFNSSASCSYLRAQLEGKLLQLEYGSDCSGRHCGPFAKSLGLYPTLMTLNQIQCSGDGRFQMYMSFPDLTNYTYYNHLLMPELSLVGEGFWDPKGNRLCLAACRIAQAKDSLADVSVSDCTIGFSLWFPAVLSIKKRSTTVGRIWSNRRKSDSAYFSTVSIQSKDDYVDTTHGLKYEYTEMETVAKFCLKSNTTNSGKGIYPDGKSFYGTRFGFSVTGAGDKHAWVSVVPLFVGETVYTNSYADGSKASMSPPALEELNHSLLHVSYQIYYMSPNSSRRTTEIAAEGIYDPGTGVLCMVGCHNPNSSHLTVKVKGLDSMDCGILINIHLAPSNPDAEESTNGTIRSTRAKSDPLYFEPLKVSSFSVFSIKQAYESVGRMHIEIAIILFSLALSCSLICVQLFHVKQHSAVLPSVSIRKLVFLTLGHMIPLVLNFLALFLMNRLRKNGLLWTDGWLEAIVVVVRIMIMVAFLLHIHFLKVAWRARPAEEAKKGLWAAERGSQILIGIIYCWGLHCFIWSFEVISLPTAAARIHY